MSPPFAPHSTGHYALENGDLIRVDLVGGRWCAALFTPNRTLHEQVFGSDEAVHRVAAAWAHKLP